MSVEPMSEKDPWLAEFLANSRLTERIIPVFMALDAHGTL